MALRDMTASSATMAMAMVADADVVWGAYETLGILDQPAQEIYEGELLATAPALTFVTADLPGLTAGESITVNGAAYTTRAPRALDDGALSLVELQA